MQKRIFLTLTVIFTMVAIHNIFAQPVQQTKNLSNPGIGFNQSINACPGGIAFGIYSFNFERMLNENHGLVARFDYETPSDSYDGGSVDATGLGFILNYRYHWSGALESWFLGSYARYRTYNGEIKADNATHDFTLPEWTLGINAGKRWVWNNGFNVTLAFGYGISVEGKESRPVNTNARTVIGDFKDDYTFMSPFLGEFSLGYAF